MKSSITADGSGASTGQPKSDGINRDEWLKALREAGIETAADDQEAVSGAEFAEMFGIHETTAHRRLRALVTAGKATRSQKRVRVSDGRVRHVQAYRLV